MPPADPVWLSEQKPETRKKQRSWVCLLILLLCIPLYGIDRDRGLDQLYHTGWTYAEGARPEWNYLACDVAVYPVGPFGKAVYKRQEVLSRCPELVSSLDKVGD